MIAFAVFAIIDLAVRSSAISGRKHFTTIKAFVEWGFPACGFEIDCVPEDELGKEEDVGMTQRG